MKTISCRDVCGACDVNFSAETSEELVAKYKQHILLMLQKEDRAHWQAVQKLKELNQKEIDRLEESIKLKCKET